MRFDARPHLTWFVLLAGCALHDVEENPPPPLDLPQTYGGEQPAAAGAVKAPLPERFWQDFGDPQLNRLVERTLQGNFDLHAAWARLAQAEALADQAGAQRWPDVGLELAIDRSQRTLPSQFRGIMGVDPTRTETSAQASIQASYELDLWNKVGSGARAAALDREAALDNVHSMAISLAAEVSEAWFDLQRVYARRAILSAQLQTSETFLELLKARFGMGQATAVDVHQQEQQVLGERAQLVLTESAEKVTLHRLALLVGQAPGSLQVAPTGTLPELPGLPGAGVPGQLLTRRPDVRAAQRRVEAADHRVAVALAARFPSLRLGASGGTQTGETFDWELWNPVWSLMAGLTQPILNGGRLAAEEERQRAVLREQVAAFGKAVLQALVEVENALVQERQQTLHIEQVQAQFEVSQQTFEQARFRYGQGLADFLTVLTALRSKHQVELSLLEARRQLISHRIQLCRALGGTWTVELSDPTQGESS